MKYDEQAIVTELLEYIAGTYSEHYVSEDDEDDIQLVDLWNMRGTAMSTCIDIAMKYPLRFGRKNGHNEQDLFKAIHFLILALHFNRKRKAREDKKPLEPVFLTEGTTSIVHNDFDSSKMINIRPGIPTESKINVGGKVTTNQIDWGVYKSFFGA